MRVTVDERVVQVREVLPGANCGACGFTGCDNYADAVVEDGAETNLCPVGGSAVAEKVAAIMGVEAGAFKRTAARVLCNGRRSVSKEKYDYQGIDSCAAAAQLFGGHKSCVYGCLGHGDCFKVCPFDAIVMTGGVARVIEDRCKACEKCVAACPKGLIEMIDKTRNTLLCVNPGIRALSPRETAKWDVLAVPAVSRPVSLTQSIWRVRWQRLTTINVPTAENAQRFVRRWPSE